MAGSGNGSTLGDIVLRVLAQSYETKEKVDTLAATVHDMRTTIGDALGKVEAASFAMQVTFARYTTEVEALAKAVKTDMAEVKERLSALESKR